MAYTPKNHRTFLEKIMGKPIPTTSNYRMPANLLTDAPNRNLTPTGLVGASSAAGGAAGLIHSVLGMKQPSDTDIYEEQLAELLKEFGHLVTSYTRAAHLGPLLKEPEFMPLWLSMPDIKILFRGTYTPIINPAVGWAKDTWDTSHKSVIATSRTSDFAGGFALNLFNRYGGNNYTGHLYILLVAPGVRYVDIQKQAVRRPADMITQYIPILDSIFLEKWNDEDEYVLESSPNIKIIHDSPVFSCSTIKEYNTNIVPSFNELIMYILNPEPKKTPIYVFSDGSRIMTPGTLEGSKVELRAFGETAVPKRDTGFHVKNVQIHVALYGFDGVVGGSDSVTVISNDAEVAKDGRSVADVAGGVSAVITTKPTTGVKAGPVRRSGQYYKNKPTSPITSRLTNKKSNGARLAAMRKIQEGLSEPGLGGGYRRTRRTRKVRGRH